MFFSNFIYLYIGEYSYVDNIQIFFETVYLNRTSFLNKKVVHFVGNFYTFPLISMW